MPIIQYYRSDLYNTHKTYNYYNTISKPSRGGGDSGAPAACTHHMHKDKKAKARSLLAPAYAYTYIYIRIYILIKAQKHMQRYIPCLYITYHKSFFLLPP